ncbi:MAG: terpene cyclase/mutase family protein [Pirellulaceae bacterium]|nr:terpene cyclase/mutase family protein [Pirellulaceae bacterium]
MTHSRRRFLASSTAAGLLFSQSHPAQAQLPSSNDWRVGVEHYLEGLMRDDGGYGWDDQQRSHLTPTFAVIGCAHILALSLPKTAELAEYVRTHHPMVLKSLEQEHRIFSYQQVQSLLWLKENVGTLRDTIFAWKKPLEYMKQYEQDGYPVFSQEVSAIVCRQLLGQTSEQIPDQYARYLEKSRRANGTFNNTPASDGSDGHVLNTWWGLRAQAAMRSLPQDAEETIFWLNRCQLPRGGFTYQPGARIGAVDDVAYTWAAVNSLKLLGGQLQNRSACIAYIHSLFNEDNGFGDRPGWCSNPMATYYALDTLHQLDALDSLNDLVKDNKRLAPHNSRQSRPLPDGLNVYSMQIEAHGQGSPREAVLLAKSLKIHLWGAKNAKPQWVHRAQELADREQIPVRFFASDEEYGTWVHIHGMGTYSHTSDIVAPFAADTGSSLAKQGVVTWEEYRQRRLRALESGGGRLIWQFGENEPLVRMLLDDSIERGGFAAISTFHFGNPDFTNSEPFLKRYRMQLPFVALQDAHGPEPWWFADMTEGFRTLFLAHEPTWEGFLKALKENWIVAVRHDAISRGQTWVHGGSQPVLDFVHQHTAQWQWWDNPQVSRPPVSIQVLRSDDLFEVGSPAPQAKDQINVRVRCAWRNTPQGLAKEPIYELMKLTLDNQLLETELKSKRRPNGLFEDHFHLASLPELDSGKHVLQAVLRRRDNEMTIKVEHEFSN